MSRRAGGWQVSDLAAEFHINGRTLRFYERVGLLKAARRTPAGHRLYSSTDRDRLRFILKAKAIGFTLDEIRDVLSTRDQGAAPCPRVLALVDAKLEAIDRCERALAELRHDLVALRREAARPTNAGCVCGLIEGHEAQAGEGSRRLATDALSPRPARATSVQARVTNRRTAHR